MPKKLISLKVAKDKILGKIENERRDNYESELRNELDEMITTNFYQVVDQTHAEIVAMYMKATKKELISMLIECNKQIDLQVKKMTFYPADNCCQCDCPTGRSVTADFEHQICDTCGHVVN